MSQCMCVSFFVIYLRVGPGVGDSLNVAVCVCVCVIYLRVGPGVGDALNVAHQYLLVALLVGEVRKRLFLIKPPASVFVLFY
jgi:hypothetical protein